MLKSILYSLDKLNFDRTKESYKKKALDILKLLKPNCYQIMIEIFGLKNEQLFFLDLIKGKMVEEKYRDIVIIQTIFPDMLENFESFKDFKRIDMKTSKDMRYFLMQKLILQNDVTTARILIDEKSNDQEDKIFLIQ